MKKAFLAVGLFFFIFIATGLMGAFILKEVNPFKWDLIGRLSLTILTSLLWFAIIPLIFKGDEK